MKFYKYHGAGNDFILMDNRSQNLNPDVAQVKLLCDRHFGIGADGLMLLENHEQLDFKMRYFNSDGREASMCGNGGRCITAFAKQLQIIEEKAHFMASDGEHYAQIASKGNGLFSVRLKMIDINIKSLSSNPDFLDSGSPHHMQWVNDLQHFPVFEQGRKIRNTQYHTEGANINFLEKIGPQHLAIRTYERGVEDETLACGTGATASALWYALQQEKPLSPIQLSALGGELSVSFKIENQVAKEVYLSGPAQFVFSGEIDFNEN